LQHGISFSLESPNLEPEPKCYNLGWSRACQYIYIYYIYTVCIYIYSMYVYTYICRYIYVWVYESSWVKILNPIIPTREMIGNVENKSMPHHLRSRAGQCRSTNPLNDHPMYSLDVSDDFSTIL
jgi:hypothetical protein